MNQKQINKAEKSVQILQNIGVDKQRLVYYQSQRSSHRPFSHFSLDYIGIVDYIKIILFGYEFNLISMLQRYDQKTQRLIRQIISIAPGYKPIQYIFVYYLLRDGIVSAFIFALLYPLPYCIFFYLLPAIAQFHSWSNYPLILIFAAGMRGSCIALFLKYSLHFPISKYHGIVFITTIVVGLIFPNNFVYIVLYLISIFLSFYLDDQQDRYSRLSAREQQKNQFSREISFTYKVVDGIPNTYPILAIITLLVSMIVLWILARYVDNPNMGNLQQLIPIGMLSDSKQMMVFFPHILKTNEPEGGYILAGTLLGLSYIFPGPHLKPFFIPIFSNQMFLATYFLLYLPPILLICIFLGYRHHFHSNLYYNIRHSILSVGNGLVICLIVQMLKRETCNFKVVFYTGVVIMCVAKLYRLREIFAVLLGVSLVCCRGGVLYLNKNVSIKEYVCLVPSS